MPDCPFYKAKHQFLESQEIRGRDPAHLVRTTIEWCEHPRHSPSDRERAARPSLGRNLTCEGERTKCPLTREQYEDVG
jgi:hypothetical protein